MKSVTQQGVPLSRHEQELTLGTNVATRGLVTLRGRDAAAHKLILGLTGSGKSVFLGTLFLQLLNQGIACLLIDPHGDLCATILGMLKDLDYFDDPRAYSRLLYIPFARQDRFIAWNVLKQRLEPHSTARLILQAFQRAWPSLGGGAAPVIEQFILNGSYVLIENGLPLTLLSRLLTDSAFCQTLLTRVQDSEVVAFFRRYEDTGRRTGLLNESTLRRIGLLTFSPALRFSLGQAENRLSMPDLMNTGTSALFDLSSLDDDSRSLIGCLLTVQVEAAALSRAGLAEHARRPLHVIIDEFAGFSAQSAVALERVLTQCRKFGVTLTLALQTWGQAASLQSALQNSMLVAFRAGDEDASWASGRLFRHDSFRVKQITPGGTPLYVGQGEQRAEWRQTLMSLRPREAYVQQADADAIKFRTLGLAEPQGSEHDLTMITNRYAELLLTPRDQIEQATLQPARRHSEEGGAGVSDTQRASEQTQAQTTGTTSTGSGLPGNGAHLPNVQRRVVLSYEPEQAIKDESSAPNLGVGKMLPGQHS